MNWIAQAERLLNTADKAAGERIKEVKEATGILSTPAVGEDVDAGAEESVVVLSAAAAALLDPEERERLIASGTARIAEDMAPSTPSASDAAGGAAADGAPQQNQQQLQRKLRVSEWSALQQELMIVNMHGRKLQGRLKAVGEQLARARAAEAAAKRQLQEASSARSAAEHAASAARGSNDEQLSAAEARAAVAEARLEAAEKANRESEAVTSKLEMDLALSRQEVSASDCF